MSFSNYKYIVFEASTGTGLFGGKDGRYATKVNQYTNTEGKKDFEFELYRCPNVGNCSQSNATHIGTRNARGELVYNNNENDTERKYYNKVNKQTKSQANSIKPSGLTASESATYNLRAGNGSQAEIDVTTADGEIIDGSTTEEKVEMTFGDINIGIKGRRFRKEYEDLSYPEGLGSNRQDRIRFEQIYSEGKTIEAGINLEGKIFQRNQKRINGSVTLPIVTGIGDKNEVDWQGATLNPLQALGASGALSLFRQASTADSIGDAFARGGTAISEGVAKLKTGTVGRDMQQAINIYLAQKAVGAQGLLSRASGAILNPNLEMLFSGPSLRNFDFTFKLSPRDANEADQIRKIIRFFKQGMSVKTSSSNVFLKAPNIFKIQYQTFNTNGDEILHPSLNIIKECALKSCDVQYTPDGTYMTYDDPFRTMTSYQLSLSFGELDPIYDSDYTELDQDRDQVIGY